MCPPAIESFEDVKTKVLEFSDGVVFQSVCSLEDSFDFDGMMKAEDIHRKIFNRILDYVQLDMGCSDVLALNAGACKVCNKCTYPDGEGCRYPDKAVTSLEAYCIDVNALLACCDIAYNNGPNTVSYVGLFLF
jgi:predicted metal-binding protein